MNFLILSIFTAGCCEDFIQYFKIFLVSLGRRYFCFLLDDASVKTQNSYKPHQNFKANSGPCSTILLVHLFVGGIRRLLTQALARVTSDRRNDSEKYQ